MTLEDEDSTAQADEIAAALANAKPTPNPYRAVTRATSIVRAPVDTGDDEWDAWANATENTIVKLTGDVKTLRLSVLASGGVALCAIAGVAATMKLVTKLMAGLQALADQQQQLGQLIAPMLPQAPGQAIPMPAAPQREAPVMTDHPPSVYDETSVRPNTAPKDRSVPDPTVGDYSAADIAPPAEGPLMGTSQTVRDLLEADGIVSMKDALPDPLAVAPTMVNPEAKSQAEREAGN